MLTGNVASGVAFSLSGDARTAYYSVDGNVVCSSVSREGERYEGQYVVTPTIYTQTLFTNDKLLEDNVTVEPIPTNYGLITWNGSFITVS